MITVSDVGVTLDGSAILRDVSLTVGQGEWVTIIGPNGAGKSTLLRAVAGLLPYTGTVTLADLVAPTRRERARLLAFVAQDPVVPPGMRVEEYVLLGRTPHIAALGRESAHDLDVVAALLVKLDLARFAGRRLETLSGGERQRVFLARALAQGASVLLLDEPTSALDIGHQQEVLDLVDELRLAGGLTVLATMHDLSIAGEYSGRMIMLAGGRVVAAGPPRQVLTAELLGLHYKARVRVIDGDQGPLVVPVR